MSAPPPTLPQLIYRRATANWGFKLLLTIIAPAVFLPIYLGIQRLLSPEDYRTLPLSFIDEAIPFDPSWVWVYISQYLIIPIIPAVAWTRDQLWRLVYGLVIVSFTAFIIFYVYPIECPRPPNIDLSQTNFMFEWIVMVDSKGNAFPSLHMGLAGLVAFYAPRVIDRAYGKALRAGILVVVWAWTLLILYSIVATKQHYFIDGVAGLALAYLGHRIAWWNAPADEPDAPS